MTFPQRSIDTNLSSQGGGSLRFFVNYDEPSGSQEALTITGAGNVGIGTTNPTLKLDIQGDLGRDNGPATLHLWDSRIGDIGGGILFLRSGVGIVTFDGNDKVGLGLNAPTCKLHVTDSLNANADNVNAHVAVIENSHGGPDADVLALKVGRSSPTASNNFITFFGGNNVVGQIEGNGPNAVTFKSGGADFAECLPRLDPDEVIEEGDIVGVFAGKISKRTKGAHHVTVISRQPIMVGNLPPMGDEHLVNKVVVVGQVRGKVRGAVQAGDFIIPSGDDDGVGMAITPDQFTAKGCTQVVGRAWESSDEMAIKTINTAVGFVASAVGEALVSMLRDQQEEIAALRTELRKLAVTRAA